MNGFQVYQDIADRTHGEFYLGVCGPVRTGKSTFIKRFMELMVLPDILDENDRERAVDELPQSSGGKTIMTTEPKFIPKEAASVSLQDGRKVSIRLIDCVGYIVQGATGIMEDGSERMVMTPWSDSPMPFTQAAEYGTRKVIHDHSTLGIVITTDGSFGELGREAYIQPEERTIMELKSIGKPFVVIVNSSKPYGAQAKEVVEQISDKYDVEAVSLNCNQLRTEDIQDIFERLLSSFPISQLAFYMPKWVEMLPVAHWLKQELLKNVKNIMSKLILIKDVTADNLSVESEYIKQFKTEHIGMENGEIRIQTVFDDSLYYRILSELVGAEIDGEYQLIHLLKEYVNKKSELDKLSEAWNQVRGKGYGVIIPSVDEITIEEPEIIHHGSKYGVKLRASSPSVHLIQANIETEIAPIVGSEQQAKDLIEYISGKDDGSGIWDTNIFGKTVRQLVEEGMESKVSRLTDESRIKLQETIQKVVNDSNGGLVCIII